MHKLTLLAFLIGYSPVALSQQDFIVFKKGNRTVALFSKDSYIAFQLKNGEWCTGYITKVRNDSFYIQPMLVRYSWMSFDTVHFDVQPFALADVFAMPKKGIQVDYVNGRNRILTSAGHVHWYWIKSGWVFRMGGGGYILLNLVNGLIKNTLSFSAPRLGIAAGVFLFGGLLHRAYKPVLRLGKKYHLQTINITR